MLQWAHRLTRLAGATLHSRKCLSSRSDASVQASDAEQALARQWLATFNSSTIPRNLCEISFSRSSGPGGQNVNKVNSKATVRLPMNILLPRVPDVLHSQLRASRYYAENSKALVIQADGSRKQGDNVEECFNKLRDIITQAGKSVVKGQTLPEQARKVKNLQSASNAARLRAKKSHSSKKRARRSSSVSNT